MKVAKAVEELERQHEAMRERAERAEGIIRMYEARDRTRAIADKAVGDGKWRIHWRQGDGEPISFDFSPALWILGVAEAFLRNPESFELRVEEIPAPDHSSPEGSDR